MEIASPTPLHDPFGQNRNKRPFSCARFSDPNTGVTVPKRRRVNEAIELEDNNVIQSPGLATKRPRTENWNQAHTQQQLVSELQRLVDHQSFEIRRLKAEKLSTEDSLAKLKPELEKTLSENRILKRAVAIQQERQNQASNEIEAACRFRVYTEERIRKLEQMNLTLRYRLEAQSPSFGNDFLKFNPHPPDVY